jgi:hypothetical protein
MEEIFLILKGQCDLLSIIAIGVYYTNFLDFMRISKDKKN